MNEQLSSIGKVRYRKNGRSRDKTVIGIHHFCDKKQIEVNSHCKDNNQCCNPFKNAKAFTRLRVIYNLHNNNNKKSYPFRLAWLQESEDVIIPYHVLNSKIDHLYLKLSLNELV